MTEGVQHVQRRNTMWEVGDYDAAWRENLILERYYPPVLDTPSFVSPTGHRWPPEQQADAAERFRATAGTGAAFVSAAYPYEIYTWPRAIFWAIATAMACAALAAGVVVDRQADRGRPEDHDRS